MSYDDKLRTVTLLIASYNQSTDDKSRHLDPNEIIQKLKELGCISEDTLAEATWEDIQDCGVPKILSRRLASVFRERPKEDPITDPNQQKYTGKVSLMTTRQLIELYDWEAPESPVARRLNTLADGKRFLVYVDNQKDVETSLQLFNELRDYGEKDTKIINESVVPVLKVGERLNNVADEHPLFPGVALRPGGLSNAEFEWGKIPLNKKQLLYLAVQSGEVKNTQNGTSDEAYIYEHLERSTLSSLFRAYPKAAAVFANLESIDNLPKLKVQIGMNSTSRMSATNQPFLAPNRRT